MKCIFLLLIAGCFALPANAQNVQRISITSIISSENTGQDYSPWLNENTDSLVADTGGDNLKWVDVKLPLQGRSLITELRFFDGTGQFIGKPAYLYALDGTTKIYLGKFEGLTYQQWVDLTIQYPVLADTIVVHKYGNNIPQKVQVYGTSYVPGTTVLPETKLSFNPAVTTINTGQDFNQWPTDNMDSLVEWGYGDRWSDVKMPLKQRSRISRLSFWDMENVFTSAPAEFYAIKDTQKTFLGLFTGESYMSWVNLNISSTVVADTILVHKFGGFIPKKVWTYGTPLLTDPLDTLFVHGTQSASTPANTAPIVKIPIDPKRWYVLNNVTDVVPKLFDSSTANVYGGYGRIINNYEAYYPVKAGEKIDLTSIRLYDGEGMLSSNEPFTLSVIDSAGQQRPVATFTGSQYNSWVGPYPGRQTAEEDKFKLDSTITNIRYLVLNMWSGYPGEIELYGHYKPATVPVSTPLSKTISFKDELGINAFEWDFESPYDPMKIDSASYAGVKNFTGVRHYMDWEKLESNEGSYTYSPVHSGGWNYDTIYQQCKKDGITVLACLKTIPSWMQATYPNGENDAENVPLPYGSDFSNPASYIKQAKMGFQYIARYGSNQNVDPSLLSVNTQPRWNHDQPNEVKIGLGVIKYIECDNERDKWWKGRRAYQTAYEYAANLSAFYDGNMNTMGAGVGVKNADPTVKIVMGGLAAPDPSYVRGMIEWCKIHRGYKADGSVNLCWDIINYHLYSNNAQSSQGGNATRGAAPEKSEAAIVARAFRQLAHDEAADMPVWITELGFDENQGSPLKAIAIGNKTVLETQADWNLRSALLYAREGIEKAFFYQLYDDNPNSGIQFGSMGFLNSNRSRKPGADYFVQANKLIGNYTYVETLSADPIVDRYEQSGKSIYALMIPDEVGRSAHYNLYLPGVDSVKICRPLIGSDTLAVQYARTSNDVLSVEVTETPLFVVPVTYGNSAANRSNNSISQIKSEETDSAIGAVTAIPTNENKEATTTSASNTKKPASQADLQTAIHTQANAKGLLKIDAKLIVYPNPASTNATVTFVADPHNETVIKLIDACTGKTALQLKVGKGNSGTIRQLDLSRLATGMYEVQLIQGKYQQHQSLIKAAL